VHAVATTKRFPIHPAHPERTCWGCDRYCGAQDMACGNGTERAQHPQELLGEDWLEWDTDLAIRLAGVCASPVR
jgi:hypothetical protein